MSRVPGYHQNQHTVYARLGVDGLVDADNIIEVMFRASTPAERALLTTDPPAVAPFRLDPYLAPATPHNSPQAHFPVTPPRRRGVRFASTPINIPETPMCRGVRRSLCRQCDSCDLPRFLFSTECACRGFSSSLCEDCLITHTITCSQCHLRQF